MSAKNNCTFTSRLGRDAEVRFTPSGVAVMGFAIPVEAGWGENKTVSWCDCSLWGKKAEGKLIDYMKKRQEIVVVGEISLETYQAKDGSEKTKLKMNVSDLALVGGNQEASRGSSHQPAQNQQQQQNQGGFPSHGGQPTQSNGKPDPFLQDGEPSR